MKANFTDKKISGILTVFPEHEHSFEETILGDNIKRVRRLKNIMGFDKRRRVKEETLISDMHKFGIQYLLDTRKIVKQDIGAIIVVTLTQDYLTPQVSHCLHGYLDLEEDVICLDIAQGCAGYIVGLYHAFHLLEFLGRKKVLLCTGDILNREKKVNEKSRDAEFGGDAASVSIIENEEGFSDIWFEYYSDGIRGKDLIMPAGGFSHPVYSEKDVFIELEDGEKANGLGIWMDGSDVFNFIMKEVPPLIERICADAKMTKDDMSYYFFHQPNRYILEKLATHMGIPYEKMPMHIVEKYGNSNSSTIPVAITDEVAEEMYEKASYCCLSGFGSGLTWAAVIMKMGEMDFCESIVSGC